jgi:hypothetical protein
MFRKIVLNFGTLLAGIAMAMVLLEICLSIYNPIVQTVKGDKLAPPVNYDEVRQNANISGLAPQVHIHQNSLGFRGADPPADLASDLSIITVGGSTVRSTAQADDRTWTALLGQAVAGCFDRSWINNAGFDGHTSFAHIQLIRDHINKLHPRVVVLLIGANELYADAPLPNDEDRDRVGIDPIFSDGLKGLLMHLAAKSEVTSLGLTLYRSFRAWKAGFTSGQWAEVEAMPSDAEAKLGAARKRQSSYAERLHLIIKLLEDNQTVTVLMTQPTVGGLGRDPTTGKDLSRLWYGNFWFQLFEIYNDTLRRVANAADVQLIDLARLMPKDTEFYYDPMHYTDAGARKVAELTARQLVPYLGWRFPSFKKDSCQFAAANPA